MTRSFAWVILCVLLGFGQAEAAENTIAFMGLHGGVFEQIKPFEKDLNVRLDYLTDQKVVNEKVDLASYPVILVQHLRSEDRTRYQKLFTSAKTRNPKLRILAISASTARDLPDLVKSGVIHHDPQLEGYYYGASERENLRRLLVYALATYLGRPGTIQPPVETARTGLSHPDHDGLFATVPEFLNWSEKKGRDIKKMPRVLVALPIIHLTMQQPRVVEALIREFEKHGVLAAAILTNNSDYEKMTLAFKPDVVVHPYPSQETVDFRKRVGAPHLQSLFFRKKSIEEWRKSPDGLDPGDFFHQIISQELLGTIEPQVGAGTLSGGGSDEPFVPIQDRIEHVVRRTVAWLTLAKLENKEKKVAFIYYDREMGKAELMRGSATGMFMNGPRSLVNVLARMKREGYGLTQTPADEDELVGWMMERGRQIGIWAPGVLDRLARSGEAVLIPVKTYLQWFEAKVPEAQRKELIARWGPPPGKFLVWEKDGEQFIVIPRINLGNVILLPQPLRGEAHDTSLVHDRHVPPPHNYLATYFWLQEEFRTHAMVHFGTHGTEFILPGKAVGLANTDWTDMVIGAVPNINPWVINNLGESSPVRRRANAVLIDHLTPPSVNAELSDELLSLHQDIDKWETLQNGALKDKFRVSITAQTKASHLNDDLHFDLSGDRVMTPSEIEQVSDYLHRIHNETTPVNLHVFGTPPREDLVIPYLVTALRKRFLDALGEIVSVPPHDREGRLRTKAEEAVALVVRRGLNPTEAVRAVGGKVGKNGLPKAVQEGFELAVRLNEGFGRTHEESDNLLAALKGRFIPPGPGNSPDRNPASLPTGRNMYVLNPEEIPSRPSWEIGKALVDQLLSAQVKSKGRYPQKIAFTLNAVAAFEDYGVMESQILYLLGVRPVWDAGNLVVDVELIPTKELGRPRVDVFIAAERWYRDMLPTRMRLLDKAIRLVAALEEKGNPVFGTSVRMQRELEKDGVSPDRAATLSRARIFGPPPGDSEGAGYYYLAERSGKWDSREELITTYLEHVKHVYTEGIWGEDTPKAYDQAIQGSELVLRNWSDRTRSPLANKYTWYQGGSLSLAIKQLTGKEPEFFLSDVRDPDRAEMVRLEDVLRRENRVRLFNRKWIEGMMKEGYAGADQVAKMVSNTLGWKIMREHSVADDVWEEIVNIYVRDSRHLAIREWFEAENPFAFQEVTELLLETIRKGYWKPDEATILEIAAAHARSVARHGEGGGLRGGENVKLEAFLEKILQAPGLKDLETLLAQYRARARESSTPEDATGTPKATEVVQGYELTSKSQEDSTALSSPAMAWLVPLCGVVALALVLLGYRFRRGVPNRNGMEGQ